MMTMKTATSAALARAAALLPLLALTACAGSQRFSGPVMNPPSYGQPALPSAPPISSAPITSEPLPPPGGYPAASAPPPASGGALPAPQDPFFEPGATAPQQGQPMPPAGQPEQAPGLRGSANQVAGVAPSATPARPAAGRDNMIGGWTAREATGGTCRVQLSSTPTLDLYRASSSGCANRDLQKITAWDYRDGEVYLYQQGGTVAARLRSGGSGSLDGAVTKSGAALSLSR